MQSIALYPMSPGLSRVDAPAPTWTVLPDLDSTSKIGLSDDEPREDDELAFDSHDEAQSNTKRPREASQNSDMRGSTKKIRLSGPRRVTDESEGPSRRILDTAGVNELEAALNRSFLAAKSSIKPVNRTQARSVSNIATSASNKARPDVQTQPRFNSLVPPPVPKSSNQSASTFNLSHSIGTSGQSSNTFTIKVPPFRKSNRTQRVTNASTAELSLPARHEATIDELETWTEADVEPTTFTGEPRYSEDFLRANLGEAHRSNLRYLLSTDKVPAVELNSDAGKYHVVAVPETPRSVRCRQLIESIFGESVSETTSREKTPSSFRASSMIKDTLEDYPEKVQATENHDHDDHTSVFGPDSSSRAITPLQEEDHPRLAQPSLSMSPSLGVSLTWFSEPPSISEPSEPQSRDEDTLEELLDELPIPKEHLHPSLDQESADGPPYPDLTTSHTEGHISSTEIDFDDNKDSRDSVEPLDIIEIVSPMVYELQSESSTFTSSGLTLPIPTPIPDQNYFDLAEKDIPQTTSAINHAEIMEEDHSSGSTSDPKKSLTSSLDDMQSENPSITFSSVKEFIESHDLDTEDGSAAAIEVRATTSGNVADFSAPNGLPTVNHDPFPQFTLLPNMLDVSKSKLPPPVPQFEPHMIRNHGSFEPFHLGFLPAPIPTIFDARHLRSRVDLRTQDRVESELKAFVESESVIVRLEDDVEMRCLEEIDDADDDEEVDELQNDDEPDFLPLSSPSKPAPFRPRTSPRRMPDNSKPQPIEVPTGFAKQVERWSTALHSLLKGKKKFQEQDMLHMKGILDSIYANREHILSTSPLADTVLTIAGLPIDDIPFRDAAALRLAARKSVRAWGLKKTNV